MGEAGPDRAAEDIQTLIRHHRCYWPSPAGAEKRPVLADEQGGDPVGRHPLSVIRYLLCPNIPGVVAGEVVRLIWRPRPPFFTRRLDAVRCALRYVASIMMVLCSALSAARPSMIRAKTPLSLQRFQPL